jgi:hypothetical protein
MEINYFYEVGKCEKEVMNQLFLYCHIVEVKFEF